MNPAIQIYDLWQHNLIRLLVGGVFLGFGVVFWWGMSQAPDAHVKGWWMVHAITAMAVVPGILILLLRQLVFLDPHRRQLTKTLYLLGIAIHRRAWSFSDLRCVVVKHSGSKSEGYGCDVGFVPLTGSFLWLRSFVNEPAAGPSAATLEFAQGLAASTALTVEVRRQPK